MKLNNTYNSTLLKDKVGDKTLDAIRRIENIADSIKIKSEDLKNSFSTLTKAERKEQLKAPSFDTIHTTELQNKLAELTAEINQPFEPSNQFDSIQVDSIHKMLNRKIEGNKPLTPVQDILKLTVKDGNLDPIRIALTLPRSVSNLSEFDAETLRKYLFDERSEFQEIKAELNAIIINQQECLKIYNDEFDNF